MPLVIRFIKSYLTWEIAPKDKVWLQKDEIPADPLSDLRTNRNKLSVYLLDDDKSQVERCAAAYAANRNKIEELDYLLFDESLIDEMQIKRHQFDGNLVDIEINKLHWNLCELSSQKLVELAMRLIDDCQTDSYDRFQITQLINNSIHNGWIKKDSLNKGIKKRL